MLAKLLKFKLQVYTLSLFQYFISANSNILNKPCTSILYALQRIKRKDNTSTTLFKPKKGCPSKISKRATRVVNRDLTRSPKKTN